MQVVVVGRQIQRRENSFLYFWCAGVSISGITMH